MNCFGVIFASYPGKASDIIAEKALGLGISRGWKEDVHDLHAGIHSNELIKDFFTRTVDDRHAGNAYPSCCVDHFAVNCSHIKGSGIGG